MRWVRSGSSLKVKVDLKGRTPNIVPFAMFFLWERADNMQHGCVAKAA